MSWRDRNESDDDPTGRLGRPGGDWRGIRPTLDNPMTWSLTVGRVARIAVRIHVIFLLFILVELARAIGPPAEDAVSPLGVGLTAIRMAVLFGIVLLHEFGHCFTCRGVGGEANEILMWPLGGLAYCMPPNRWRAHLATAAGGPAVNVLICLLLGPLLAVLTGCLWGVGVPNPIGWPAFGVLQVGGEQPLWLLVLFMVHDLSFVLLLFNLLPLFPLDGGRIVQALLWPRLGYVRSMRWAVRIGYFGAIGLGLFGAVFQQWLLIGIAIFGGLTCYMTHKQLEWTQAMMGFEDDDYAVSLHADKDEEEKPRRPTRAERQSAKRAEKRQREDAEVDRILDKIAASGSDSLTARERRLLDRATRRRRTGR